MYLGYFRDIDETLYTVKIQHIGEEMPSGPKYTLTVDRYETSTGSIEAIGITATFTGEYAIAEQDGEVYEAMVFTVTNIETNLGTYHLTKLYVYPKKEWDNTNVMTDMIVCHVWDAETFDFFEYTCVNPVLNRDLGYTELTLSSNPVIISQESDGLFSSIKPSRCTVEVVAAEVYTELFAYDNQSLELYIYRDNLRIFEGFVTPYIYNQPYANYLDVIQVEAVSKLSTLKDIDYYTITENLNITSVANILKHLFINGAKYNPDTFEVRYMLSYSESLADFKISEGNFFDDDDTHTPWKMEDVLSEICKYFGVSCFEWEGVIFLVDYWYMQQGINAAFRRIRLDSLDNTFYTYPKPLKTITADLYTSDDSNISYDDIYNKVNINVNTYNIEELGTDVEDLQNSTNLSSYPQSSTWYYTTYKANGKVKSSNPTFHTYNTFRMLNTDTNWKHRYWKIKPHKWTDGSLSAIEINKDETQDKRWYDTNSLTLYNNNRYDQINTRCAFIGRYAYYDADDTTPSKIDWNEYIGFMCLDDTVNANMSIQYDNANIQVASYIDVLQNPVLEYTLPEPLRFSPNVGTSWITIKGELLYQHTKNDGTHHYIINTAEKSIVTHPLDGILDVDKGSYIAYDLDQYNSKGSPEKTKNKYIAKQWPTRSKDHADYGKGYPLLKCKLQIGDKYWNGSAWTTTDSTFYINFNNSPSDGATETFNCWEWQKIAPNYTFTDKLDDNECWAIPIKKSDNVSGRLTFTLYTPSQLGPMFEGSSVLVPWKALFPIVYMQGFELNYVYTDTSRWYLADEKKDDEDIVYSNTVDTTYNREYEDIELKINTYTDNVPISRSFMMFGINNEYVTKFFNTVARKSNILEYHNIERILSHHIDKKLIYETTLKCYAPNTNDEYVMPLYAHEISLSSVNTFKNENGNNKRFMLDSYEMDLKNNNITTKLIEW